MRLVFCGDCSRFQHSLDSAMFVSFLPLEKHPECQRHECDTDWRSSPASPGNGIALSPEAPFLRESRSAWGCSAKRLSLTEGHASAWPLLRNKRLGRAEVREGLATPVGARPSECRFCSAFLVWTPNRLAGGPWWGRGAKERVTQNSDDGHDQENGQHDRVFPP